MKCIDMLSFFRVVDEAFKIIVKILNIFVDIGK